MVVSFVYLVIGLLGLYFGGEWLVKGASRLAASFGVSPLIIGLTIVAAGTSSPELIVNVSAALRGNTDIALGNVVGSNIANIGLILGVGGLIAPMVVGATVIRREIPIMIVVSVLLYAMAFDNHIGHVDGIILAVGFVVFVGTLIYLETRNKADRALHDFQELEEELHTGNRWRELGWIVAGIVLLSGGAQFMVEGATTIAREVGVSELVIGLTLVALGTSLPELATTIVSAMRKQTDILVGNIIGSNIFNILLILGVTGAIKPVPVEDISLQLDFPMMLALSLILLPFTFNRKLVRWEAAVFIISYALYIILAFAR